MEHFHFEVKMIEDPSDMEAYTNPFHTYVLVSSLPVPDCNYFDICICHNFCEVMNAYNAFKKHYNPIFIEEIYNWEDYDEDTLDYIISCFQGIEVDSMPVECEVEWENTTNPDFSCKFTTDLDGGINMQ